MRSLDSPVFTTHDVHADCEQNHVCTCIGNLSNIFAVGIKLLKLLTVQHVAQLLRKVSNACIRAMNKTYQCRDIDTVIQLKQGRQLWQLRH
jgi:hypothetical protein